MTVVALRSSNLARSSSIYSKTTKTVSCVDHITFFPPPVSHFSQLPVEFHACPSLDSFVSNLITAISSCSSTLNCRVFHAKVIKFVNYRHGFIGDQLVSCYLKLGGLHDAEKLFDEMSVKDLLSWNSLISGYSKIGNVDKCLNAFSRMRFELGIQPNEVTFISLISSCADMDAVDEGKYVHGIALKSSMLMELKVVNALINFYGKTKCLDAACRLFESMPLRNFVSWNSIIAVHIQNGFAVKGLEYFNIMRRSRISSDQATILTVLQACEILGVAKLAMAIHSLVLRCGFNSNVAIETAILDLYAKLGMLDESRKIFGKMCYRDGVAWTAMLAAYAMHGCGRAAIEHFELMVRECVKPDHVTFTHLLSACSHSGLVNEGKYYFNIMSEVYRVEPRLDHFSCMVDLMGRSGRLREGYELIKNMPMEPSSGVWGSLLGACRVYGDIHLGKEIAEKLFGLVPSDSRNYIMLSNIYSAAGLRKDASRIRVLMKERGLIRKPGYSYIEHGNKIHGFVVGDRSHPESENIYKKLEYTIGKIREAGFVSRTEFVLQDVDENVKEDAINQHSEKLAMAFGLLVIPRGLPIIVIKNLRICGDCHEMAKFISRIENRTVIIRDSKRFHHFVDGVCSCLDYW